MQQARKDMFGYVNQGVNYLKFRPEYPLPLVGRCIQGLNFKRNYMDVATGTGQLLFALGQSFSGIVVGTDISEKMLEVTRQKAVEVGKRCNLDIRILNRDCLEKAPDNLKFDLITVGQALHWFNVDKFLQNSKEMLTKDGRLAVLGYYVGEISAIDTKIEPVEEETPQEAEKRKKKALSKRSKQLNQHYLDFFQKVKPQFDFDRDELHEEYTLEKRYTFNKHFPKVQRLQSSMTTKMPRENFLGYLKTWSAYNIYLQKYKKDPIIEIEEELKQDKQINMTVKYFGIYCSASL